MAILCNEGWAACPWGRAKHRSVEQSVLGRSCVSGEGELWCPSEIPLGPSEHGAAVIRKEPGKVAAGKGRRVDGSVRQGQAECFGCTARLVPGGKSSFGAHLPSARHSLGSW